MAIFTNVYGDGRTPDYEGCVLDWYEHNGYDDSDWYAICWNEEKQEVEKVLFDTTRCACSGRAEIDATPEVLRKVYHYWKALGKSLFDGRTNRMQAMKIHVGDTVRVFVKVVEGSRERLQAFEGVVIARRNGSVRETFTVRRTSYGVGVERTFPLHSPRLDHIMVIRRGKVRRAKLYYLRERSGKAAKVKER